MSGEIMGTVVINRPQYRNVYLLIGSHWHSASDSRARCMNTVTLLNRLPRRIACRVASLGTDLCPLARSLVSLVARLMLVLVLRLLAGHAATAHAPSGTLGESSGGNGGGNEDNGKRIQGFHDLLRLDEGGYRPRPMPPRPPLPAPVPLPPPPKPELPPEVIPRWRAS